MTKRKKRKPNYDELMTFHFLSGIGMTPNAVAVKTGWDPHTVRKYLRSGEYTTPLMKKMVKDAVKAYRDKSPEIVCVSDIPLFWVGGGECFKRQ